MAQRTDLFPKGKIFSKAKRIDLIMNSSIVQLQNEKIKQQYRLALEQQGKKKKKEPPTLDRIVMGIKKELFSEDYFKGYEPGIGRVSASKLNTFKGCRFAYLLQYRLHLQPPIQFPHVVSGECMHSVLEEFNLGNLRTFEEMIHGRPIQVIKDGKLKQEKIKGWRAKWYGSAYSKNILFRKKGDEHFFYNRGVGILKNFYEKEKDTPKTRPDLIERKFSLVLNCKPYVNMSYNTIGFFDRIDIENDKIIITDYKTGDSGPVLTDLGHQLTIYWHAYNKYADLNMPHFPKPKSPKDIELVIYHLPTLEKKSTTRDEIVDMKYLAYEINDADNDIKAKNFKPFVGIHCNKNCWWQELCHEILMPNNKEIFNLLITSPAERAKIASYA